MSWGARDYHDAGDQWGGGGGNVAASNFDNAAQFGGGDIGGGGTTGFGTGDGADEQGFTVADAGDGAAHGGGACFNCGKEGHMKSDCPEPQVPREFTGECRVCGTEGHRAIDCPNRPPMVCNNCKGEGHQAVDCKNPRAIDRSDVEDVDADTAWDMIAAAVNEHDMDDVKDAIQKYLKSQPTLTYLELETAFRSQGIEVYIIAVEKSSMLGALTNMDLQGNLDKKYQITYRFDNRPARPREAPNWPKSAEDNLERLKDAGEPVNRGLMKCNNCDQFGHISKNCAQDKVEKDRVVIKCFNCNEEGHRVRDCDLPRIDKFACKNCGQLGHKVSECPEPPNPANIECRKCNEMGHFSRDCPQGGGGGGACHNCGQEGHRSKECTEERKIICRNCDAEGHVGRDCPKPRDYSRVKCSNCDQMGHTKVRCKEPIRTDPDEAGIVGGDAGLVSGDAGFGSGDVGVGTGNDDFGRGFGTESASNGFGGGEPSAVFAW